MNSHFSSFVGFKGSHLLTPYPYRWWTVGGREVRKRDSSFIKKYGGLGRSHPWLSYFTQGPLWIHQQMPLGLLSERNGESGHLSAHLPQHHSLLLPLSPQPPLHPTSREILINLVCMVLLNNQHLSFSKSKMMDICTHLLYPLLCWWAFRFLPCLVCCQ